MNTVNTTPDAFSATVSEKQASQDFSPREHVIENIYNALIEAHETKDCFDAYGMAVELLDFIEQRVVARDDSGELLFANPDHPTGALDPETGVIHQVWEGT